MSYSAADENFEKSKGMENYRLEPKKVRASKSKAIKKAKVRTETNKQYYKREEKADASFDKAFKERFK